MKKKVIKVQTQAAGVRFCWFNDEKLTCTISQGIYHRHVDMWKIYKIELEKMQQ